MEPLPPIKPTNSLNILLVIGEKQLKTPASSLNLTVINTGGETNPDQALESEAANLIRSISPGGSGSLQNWGVKVKVDTLIRPEAEELTRALDTGKYQAFFYAGHGMAAPNGGSLFLRPGEQLNGTELAQALVRNQVILAVFNACWGAYPAKSGQEMIPRSSLAEVLIHHGVPAVLAMRDAIADREALSFIEVFNAVFRINPREAISKNELEIFLYNKDEQVQISTNLIRKLSPDSLSVMEFKQDMQYTRMPLQASRGSV